MNLMRKLKAYAGNNGVRRYYLVQYSADSGKLNSTAGLAHRVAILHDAVDAKILDSMLVVTDRLGLDPQLQSTIYRFEHKT